MVKTWQVPQRRYVSSALNSPTRGGLGGRWNGILLPLEKFESQQPTALTFSLKDEEARGVASQFQICLLGALLPFVAVNAMRWERSMTESSKTRFEMMRCKGG